MHYFIAVAEEASFTRAATRMRVAQPAISQQVAQLERELGEKLFDRSDRRVRLTVAGTAFLPHARAAIGATEAGRDAVRSLTGILTGRLAVGSVQAPPPALPRLLADFSNIHPGVSVTLRVGHPEEVTEELAGGVVDVAVLALAGQRLPAVLAVRALDVEPLVLAAAPQHPIAGRQWSTLSTLEAYPVVTMTRRGGLRATLDAACARAGVTPRIAVETDDVTLVPELLLHNEAWVALLPASVAQRAPSPLATVPLRRPALQRRTVLAWHRHNVTAVGQALLTLVA